MTPHYSKIHNRFKLNGFFYNADDLLLLANSFIKEGEEFQYEIGVFILDWLDDNDFIVTQTSGTTGKPKAIKIQKQAMVNSAIATGDFFALQPGNSALHCLPSKFIAGKMMLVRAFVLGLEIDLVNPQGKIEIDSKMYDFAAMVPLQVENNFEQLSRIKTLIIGGAQPNIQLVSRLQKLTSLKAYETYGMTETITHIAAKEIISDFFQVLPEISIYKDERDCLVIDAPRIASEKIITNDLVDIVSENQFKWLGRIDNVINSGGIKLFPEQIEKKLQPHITNRLFISSKDDDKLGNKIVLVIEQESNDFDTSIFKALERYEKPKEIYFTSTFSETKTGKINRNETLKKVRTVL